MATNVQGKKDREHSVLQQWEKDKEKETEPSENYSTPLSTKNGYASAQAIGAATSVVTSQSSWELVNDCQCDCQFCLPTWLY